MRPDANDSRCKGSRGVVGVVFEGAGRVPFDLVGEAVDGTGFVVPMMKC